MRFLEKFFLFIFSLCLAALGVGGIWACYDANLLRYVNWLATMMTQNRWITLVASACLLLLAILLLFGVVFHSSGRKKENGMAVNVIMVGESGSNVQISTAAVDCIIQQQKKDYPAVKELESKISQMADGAQIMLKVVASADANIPELANNLQNSVKTQLENMVGLKVASVKIIVADVITDNFTQHINTDKNEPTV
jgi:Uncharacterized protein conserved in bacteria